MQEQLSKKYPTIGCCGIDCGLCPRFHTQGISKCPGCLGKGFNEKHPSCSIITCCVKSRRLETCADCEEFICNKIRDWDQADSFVTHRNSLANLAGIRKYGLAGFAAQQKRRMELLEELLESYDDGRSKSFYCLASALLPVADLRNTLARVAAKIEQKTDRKLKAKTLKLEISGLAEMNKTELVYRKKKS